MANWRTQKITDTYREIVNIDTGAVRRINFASDKQMKYLESLRLEMMKDKDKYAPLKAKPSTFQAAKMIDKLLERKSKRDIQGQLL